MDQQHGGIGRRTKGIHGDHAFLPSRASKRTNGDASAGTGSGAANMSAGASDDQAPASNTATASAGGSYGRPAPTAMSQPWTTVSDRLITAIVSPGVGPNGNGCSFVSA